jgi:hypothetical protein
MIKNDSIIAHSKNYNSQDILNMALGTFISKQMISILRSTKSITASQIFKLIAILSLDEIRISFMKMLKKIFGIVGENYLTILQYIDKYILKNTFVRIFKYFINYIIKCTLKILGIRENNMENSKEITIKFIPTLNFMKKFIKYINPENYKIDKIHNIKLQENNVTIYRQTWLNIKTSYKMININLSSDLIMTFEKINNSSNLIKYNTKDTEQYNEETEIELIIISNNHNEVELYEIFNDFIKFIDKQPSDDYE